MRRLAILLLLLPGCGNDTTLVGLPLRNEPPTAAVSGATQLAPLDTAQLDGSASSDPDGAIADFHWEIVDRPTGSSANVVPIAGGAHAEFFVDLAGDYVVSLTVTDDRGAQDTAELAFSAVPYQSLHVQLTWDTPGTDVDLHVVNEAVGGSFCGTPYDCFYGNKNPNWGSFASSADDPRLDIDDLSGFGPENVNVDTPEVAAQYRLYVHYYRDDGRISEARIRIYLHGALAWEGTRILSSTNKTWDVARIDWPTQTITATGALFDAPCGP